jgi:hypothetical protein
MKSSIFVLALAVTPLVAGPIDQGQRDFALSTLHSSRKAFLDSIAGLSDAQWKFKPAPDRWSIQEVAEHIILSEDGLFGFAQKTMQSPAVPERKDDRAADQTLLSQLTDRSQKYKNPPELTPTGRFATPKDAAQAFKEKRDHTLDYVRTTEDDLRAHVAKGPAGEMDPYQILLMLAGHSNRHVLQIQEVKATEGYPGK